MSEQYSRIAFASAGFLIAGALMGIAGFLQMSMGNPVGFVSLIACLMFVINGIWGMSTPFVILNENEITIKDAMLRQNTFQLKDIRKIEMVGKNMTLKGDSWNFKLRLGSMASDQRKDFVENLGRYHQKVKK